MGEKWLELKVMYCKDLKLFNFFQKLNVYAVVSLVTTTNEEDGKEKEMKRQQEQRTPTDNEGDGNPEWNHVMRFDLGSVVDDERLHRTFLHFDLRSDSNGILLALGGERCIGQVWVPLKDVVNNTTGIAPPRFVNYEVRTLDGKSNGVINFSFKLLNFKQQQHDNYHNNNNLPAINVHHHQNSPIHYPSINMNETNSPNFYYDAVSSPVTPYSPQQGYNQYPPPPSPHHQFSPLRPSPPVAYPPQYAQPPLLPVPYSYPPTPPPQHHHEYPQVFSPNWAQYPEQPDPLYGGGGGGGGGYNYFHGPGSPGTPIGSETTTWPSHFPPGGDHFSPSWNAR